MREVREGVMLGLPIVLAVAPFALVVGALAVQAGLSPLAAVAMSATVYAGASQLVAIDLWAARVPVWSIVLAVLAVNTRHLLYSAAMTPLVRGIGPGGKALTFFLLVDPQFAFAQKRYEEGRGFSLAWYLGLGAPIWLSWVGMTALGASFGNLIADPNAIAIDMLLPIYFFALVMSFRSRRAWGLVVATSAVVSALVYNAPALGVPWLGAPWHITVGGLAGILVAAALPPGPGRAIGQRGPERGAA